MLLNEGMKGLPFYRSVFYLPSMLGSSVAIAVLWRQMFGIDGLVNQVLRLFGIDAHIGWICDPSYALWTIILLHVWTFGSPMVIFLAGLRQIPGMYYEAASVDGASRWAQFSKITLPLLSPIIFFNLVLQIIGAFQAFTQAFVVSNGTGGPSDSTMFYTLYLYQKGFGQFQMGYASAMAWLLVVIVGGLHRHQLLRSQSIGCSTVTDLQIPAASAPAAHNRPGSAGGDPASAHGGDRARSVIKHVLLIAASLIMIYPLLWMLVSSLRPTDLIFRTPGLWLNDLYVRELHRGLVLR